MAHRALWDSVEDVMEDYYERCRAAEALRQQEVEAAVVLQSAWRGKLQRMHLGTLDGHVRTIQRFWRGYRGRRRFAAAREDKDRELRQAYFHRAAIEIQRRWRGYWSRKHVHSFAARKAYLAAVSRQNAAVRRDMADALRLELDRHAGGRRETAREQFERQVGQLHHLVSTAAVPGIFRPPFEAATGLVLVVEGLTIEEHLQRACRAQVVPGLQRRLQEAAAHPAKYTAAAHGGGQGGRAASPLQQPAEPPGGSGAAAHQRHDAEHGPATQPTDGRAAAAGRPGGKGGAAARGGAAGAPAAGAADGGGGGGGGGNWAPPASTLRQMAPYDAVKDSAALERRINRAQVAVLHRHPFLGPSSTINTPFLESPPTVRSAGAYTDPVVGAIPGARAASASAPAPAATGAAQQQPAHCGGETGRLFDASGRRRGFFDPSLRQGY